MDDEYAELFKKLPSGQPTGASWQDVRAEFEALGKTLGDVLRGTWQRSDNEAALGGARDSLQSLIRELNRAVDGTPEAKEARERLVRLTDAIRSATARAGDEVRPELLSMLRQANAELRRAAHLDQ